MRVLAARSQVVSEHGWLWLRPVTGSVRLQPSLASLLLATLVPAAIAAWSLLPRVAGVPLTAVLVALGAMVVVRTALQGATRLAMGDLGVVIQDGAQVAQVAWGAIEGLRGVRVRGRVRIALDAGRDSRVSRAGFDPEAAREWLDHAAAEADRRNLRPVAAENGLGFTATGPT